jgi:hypothetical protein
MVVILQVDRCAHSPGCPSAGGQGYFLFAAQLATISETKSPSAEPGLSWIAVRRRAGRKLGLSAHAGLEGVIRHRMNRTPSGKFGYEEFLPSLNASPLRPYEVYINAAASAGAGSTTVLDR